MPSFATVPKTLRRPFECSKNYFLECETTLHSQGLTRAMIDHIVTTWKRSLVAPNIIVTTLHKQLLMLFSTVNLTSKSRTSILHCEHIAPTDKRCNQSLASNDMLIYAIHSVTLWIAIRQGANLRYHPFTTVPHIIIEECARVSTSIICFPSSACNNTTTVYISTQGSSSPQQHPSELAPLLGPSTVLPLMMSNDLLKTAIDYVSRVAKVPPLLKGSLSARCLHLTLLKGSIKKEIVHGKTSYRLNYVRCSTAHERARVRTYVCIIHICKTHVGSCVYTSGNTGITRWFRTWGARKSLTYGMPNI
jgi:hypothetical protein